MFTIFTYKVNLLGKQYYMKLNNNFFREDTPFYTSSLIDTLTINPNQSIYYRIFSATDIPYLKVEEILGSSHL